MWRVVSKPVTRTAMITNTSETTASRSIRHFPASPPDRRRQTFMRSSARPMAPHASVVASTSIACVLRVERITNGSVVASRIRTPPIVGVPCFCAWASGIRPSARMNCPTSWRRSQAMNLGPRNISSIAALMAAIRTRGNERSVPDAARAACRGLGRPPASRARDDGRDALQGH